MVSRKSTTMEAETSQSRSQTSQEQIRSEGAPSIYKRVDERETFLDNPVLRKMAEAHRRK